MSGLIFNIINYLFFWKILLEMLELRKKLIGYYIISKKLGLVLFHIIFSSFQI